MKFIMSDNTTIYTSDGVPIKRVDKVPETFIDKTTMIYGGSNTGKTVLIKEILNICENRIPNYIAIMPKTAKKHYSGMLPKKAFKSDLSRKRLEIIWERQMYLADLYEKANDPVILRNLFVKCNDRNSNVMIEAINRSAERKISSINSQNDIAYNTKESKINIINDIKKMRIKLLYKTTIRENEFLLQGLKERGQLTDDEIAALDNIDLNPRLMIIVDDCTENFSTWHKYYKKNEPNIFDMIFTQGRHKYITFVVSIHNITEVYAGIRRNIHISYFTDAQAIGTYIENSKLSPPDKKHIRKIADTILVDNPNSDVKTHQKLIFIKEDISPWRYNIARLVGDFKLGGDGFIKLCNKLPEGNQDISNNPYFNRSVAKPAKRPVKITVSKIRKKY